MIAADPAASVPLTLLVYPALWDRSCELHPRGPGYSWTDHLRSICKLARALHQEQPIALKVASLAEQLHIRALAEVPVEILILDVQRDRLARPNLPTYELWWLDATDAHIKPGMARAAAPAPARTVRPKPHI
jgi:hypothetical protein